MTDSFQSRTSLSVGAHKYDILSLNALKDHKIDRLPFSLKILLENLLRFEDGVNVTARTSKRCCSGTPRPSRTTKSPLRPRGSSCRTSPVCRA